MRKYITEADKKKYKPFVRASGSERDDHYRTKVIKAKFDQSLDDIAYTCNLTDIREGDLIDPYGDEEGDAPNTKHQWWEVMEVQFLDENYEHTYNNPDRMFVYLYPVDEFGNALTKTQIKKAFPGSQGENYVKKIESTGYAKMTEYRSYEDDSLSHRKILRVPTDEIENWDNPDNIKTIGRKVRSMDKVTKTFYKKDAHGYKVPSEEGLAKWKEKHPGEEFDPEFDSLDDDRDYVQDQVPYRGNKATRQNYAKRVHDDDAEEIARRDARKAKFGIAADKNYDEFSLYSCFSGFNGKFDKLQKDAGISEEDLELLKKYAKSLAYGRHGDPTPFNSKKEFKKWVIEHNGDWEATEEAMSNISGQFATARANAYGY